MGQRILVVDDSRTVCRVIQWVFHASPSEVQVVHTGDEALRAMRASKPDVAIIDYQLPDQTGIELVERMRGDDRLSSTAVLILGGEHHPFDAEAARAAGADAVTTKPFTTDTLLEAVSEATSAARDRNKAAFAPPPPKSPPPPPPGQRPETKPVSGFRRLKPVAPAPPSTSGFRKAPIAPPAPPAAPLDPPGGRQTADTAESAQVQPTLGAMPPEPPMQVEREHLIPESQSDAYLQGGIELEDAHEEIEIEHEPPAPPQPSMAAPSDDALELPPAPDLAPAPTPRSAAPKVTAPAPAVASVDAAPAVSAGDVKAAVSDLLTPELVQQAVLGVLTPNIIREAVSEVVTTDVLAAAVSTDDVNAAVTASLENEGIEAIVRAALPDLIKASLPSIVKEYLASMLRTTGDKLEAYSNRKIDEFCEKDLPRIAAEVIEKKG